MLKEYIAITKSVDGVIFENKLLKYTVLFSGFLVSEFNNYFYCMLMLLFIAISKFDAWLLYNVI